MDTVRLVVAMTGASGVVYGKRLLEILSRERVETLLVLTRSAERILAHELETTRQELTKLAKHVHDEDELTAPISSGSYPTDGMVITPCSMKTLAGIACGFSDNLVLRAADVTIKQGRRLILVPRETPLSPIHLENMHKLACIGVTILPAMPGFYHNPKTLEDLVDFVVGKILDELNIRHSLYRRWTGITLPANP